VSGPAREVIRGVAVGCDDRRPDPQSALQSDKLEVVTREFGGAQAASSREARHDLVIVSGQLA
jgi:hypothetical protein